MKALANALPGCVKEIDEHKVRNCEELVPWIVNGKVITVVIMPNSVCGQLPTPTKTTPEI